MSDDLKRIIILHSNDIHGKVGGFALEVRKGKRKKGLL